MDPRRTISSVRIVFRCQVISGEFWRKIAVKPGKTRKSPGMMKTVIGWK
jgi:hypothetical protein